MLIATYEYQDTALRRLTSPAHDAEALAAVLEDPAIAGFEVTTLVNQPHHRVGKAIGDFYRNRSSDDLTLLYFTGHGLKNDDGLLYLAMADTRRDGLLFTGLSAEQINQAMDGCMSRQKVLILDCCYSGAFPAGRPFKADTAVHALERFRGRGRTVLTASDATQYSFEGNQAHGQAVQSVFTRYLVEGLRDGSADLDGDGDITLDELYGYVHDRVVNEMPQQRPKRQDNVEGRIVIASNINWTLPAHLQNAVGSPIAADRLGALDGLAHLHRIGNNVVRQRALGEIQRLVDDDSRTVSAAAVAHLQSLAPSAPQPASAASSEAGPVNGGSESQDVPVGHREAAYMVASDTPSPSPQEQPENMEFRPLSFGEHNATAEDRILTALALFYIAPERVAATVFQRNPRSLAQVLPLLKGQAMRRFSRQLPVSVIGGAVQFLGNREAVTFLEEFLEWADLSNASNLHLNDMKPKQLALLIGEIDPSKAILLLRPESGQRLYAICSCLGKRVRQELLRACHPADKKLRDALNLAQARAR